MSEAWSADKVNINNAEDTVQTDVLIIGAGLAGLSYRPAWNYRQHLLSWTRAPAWRMKWVGQNAAVVFNGRAEDRHRPHG